MRMIQRDDRDHDRLYDQFYLRLFKEPGVMEFARQMAMKHRHHDTLVDALLTALEANQDKLNPRPRLTMKQAEEIEDEMRRLEADPAVTKNEMRLFMQTPMPCGHATGNLLTCPTPPLGCVICGEPTE